MHSTFSDHNSRPNYGLMWTAVLVGAVALSIAIVAVRPGHSRRPLMRTHAVTLTWSPSTSVVVGYNVYRSTQSGGPYSKLNSSPVSVVTYTDNTTLGGQTYFYVATGVNASGVESGFSNEAQATIPSS